MKKSADEIFELFNKKLRQEYVYDTNMFETEILSYYNQLIDILSSDYVTYRKFFPQVLSALEHNDTKSFAYSTYIFFQLFNKLITFKNIKEMDLSFLNEEITNQTEKKYRKLFEVSMKTNCRPRISEFNVNTDKLSEQEIKEIVTLIIEIVEYNSKTLELSNDQGNFIITQLPILRCLLNKLKKSEIFYISIGMFIDCLNSSEHFQHARDFSEEIIISGFNDNIPEFGFFNSFRCYSSQGSINAAILYANISLYCAINKGKPVFNKYLQEIIWQSLKYFRNIKLHHFVIDIYKKIPTKLKFSEYEKRAIDHTYFSCLVKMGCDSLPNLILDYLHQERESIFQGGIEESTPWLITLYNIKRLYPNADFSSNGLGFYLSVFEKIVPKERVGKYKCVIEGDSRKIKSYLKKSLINLNDTRNQADIGYDNEFALALSNRLIEDSFSKQDKEAILLAMMLKSDFSLTFHNKDVEALIPFKLSNNKIEKFNAIYSDKKEIQKNLSMNNSELYIWLAVTEGKVFQLSHFDNNFEFNNLINWNWMEYNKLITSDYFSQISFDDTIEDQIGVRKVLKEDCLEQASKIIKSIDFCKLAINQRGSTIFLVKDMELTNFPHNLFLDEQGTFIHLEKPITNILSTEWYLSRKKDSFINKHFSKSIWIPTIEGNLILNMLYDSLKEFLQAHQFSICQKTKIESPLSSEVNIICSHGAKDIAFKQFICPNNPLLVNPNHIIGKGKILIFFVCHSGSYQREIFGNNITSIVKTFIAAGYKAVIAPFWALHVKIPEVWLPVFIDSLNNGNTIDYALFNANKAVYLKYPTPSAWASMHLYGNPHLVISK